MRAYRGRSGAWFRTARATRTGHIAAGGVDRVVTFTEVDDPALAERLDGAPARVLGARPRSGRTTGPARNASTGLRHPGPPTPLVQRVKKFPDLLRAGGFGRHSAHALRTASATPCGNRA
ncbi:DUF2255 family protein [Streptomyces sp. NBC_01602]|uniref:DUF2255 family protein n=1 Tax=Streptomyces sp. NBC_01602 TaxID=2975893 RepID=UPI003864BA48